MASPLNSNLPLSHPPLPTRHEPKPAARVRFKFASKKPTASSLRVGKKSATLEQSAVPEKSATPEKSAIPDRPTTPKPHSLYFSDHTQRAKQNFSPDKTVQIHHSNWMKNVSDNTPLDKMTIPGTHDSCTAYSYLHHDKITAPPKKSGFFKCLSQPLKRWTAQRVKNTIESTGLVKTQDKSITDQLNSGIRFLDIRCAVKKKDLIIHHGIVPLGIKLRGVLQECTKFLDAHPSEVILMKIKQEFSKVSNSKFIKEFNKVINDGYSSYIWQNPYIPTLGNVRGKIVILSHKNVAKLKGIPWSSINIENNYHLVATHPNEKSLDKKKTLIHKNLQEAANFHAAQPSKAKMYLTYISATPAAALIANHALRALAFPLQHLMKAHKNKQPFSSKKDTSKNSPRSSRSDSDLSSSTDFPAKVYDVRQLARKLNPYTVDAINLIGANKSSRFGIIAMDFPGHFPTEMVKYNNLPTKTSQHSDRSTDSIATLAPIDAPASDSASRTPPAKKAALAA